MRGREICDLLSVESGANAAECGAGDRAAVSVEVGAGAVKLDAPLGQTIVQVVPWRRPLTEWRRATARGIEMGGFQALGGGYWQLTHPVGLAAYRKHRKKTMSP